MRAALGLSAMLFCLLSLSSCKDSEDTPDDPGRKTEETDTVTQKVKVETPTLTLWPKAARPMCLSKPIPH